MQIELTRGYFATIDDADYDLVRAFRWVATGTDNEYVYAGHYWSDSGGKKLLLMHRLIAGANDNLVVDHIDGDCLNNRRSNLRLCTQAENLRNSRARPSLSGIRNVRVERRTNGTLGWRACVTLDGKRHRKWFHDAASAEQWAAQARQRLHGQFAYPAHDR